MSHPLPPGLWLFPPYLPPPLSTPLSFSTSKPLPASLFVSLYLHSLPLGLPSFQSVSALHPSPCLNHWDMLLTGVQKPFGSPHPVICAPLPQLRAIS